MSDLDTPLLRLNRQDVFTLRDACAGVHVFGAIGSGKTSGSGQALAGAYLRAGMGGLVCCAKPEEVELWLRYAKAHGRSNSVLLFDEHQGFNFLAYELARQGMAGIGSVTECLMRVLEAARRTTPTPGGTGDVFWQDATRQLLSYAIPPLYAANGTVSVSSIIAFVLAAATSPEQLADEEFQQTNLAYQTLFRAATNPKVPIAPTTLEAVSRYWFNEYTAIPARTRGNIVISLSTTLGRFNHGRLHDVFCGSTSILPDLVFNGAIIVMAMPVLSWNEDGIIGQQLFKYMWQRVIESRNGLPPKFRDRPVFLWADEAQYFVNSYDSDFLSTCRGSRACVVYLTQNLPTYYAKMGAAETHAADALVGKFNTQIFHQNACPRTNSFASSLIGRGIQQRATYSEGQGTNRNFGMNAGSSTNRGSSSSFGSSSGQGGSSSNSSSGRSSGSGENWGDNRGVARNESYNQGYSEVMENLIEPAWFSHGLTSGGPRNRNRVTAVWFRNGGAFEGADSDEGGHLFQLDRGHHSNLMAAGSGSSRRPVLFMSWW
jgi:hypothetical protein